MSSSSNRIRVRVKPWRDKKTGIEEPMIFIYMQQHFVVIPIDDARRVVDEVHDICDHDPRY